MCLLESRIRSAPPALIRSRPRVPLRPRADDPPGAASRYDVPLPVDPGRGAAIAVGRALARQPRARAAATDIALESADIALMQDDWRLIPEAFITARRTSLWPMREATFTDV